VGRAAARAGLGALLLVGTIAAGAALAFDLGRAPPDCQATLSPSDGVPWSCRSVANAPIPDGAEIDEEGTDLVRSTQRVVLSIDAFV